MSAPDYRSIPALVRLVRQAEVHGLSFNQAKFDRLWEKSEAANVPPLFMLAILPQEGTGSFDTSSEHKAADGGNGIETDWERDTDRAISLVAGKLALYPSAWWSGFPTLAQRIISPGDGDNWQGTGGPVEWVNWATAVLRANGTVDTGACYAQHGSWWVGVCKHYRDMGGRTADLTAAACRIATQRRAPDIVFDMRVVRDETDLASNWNATAPEPAVVVTDAQRTGDTLFWLPVTLPNGTVVPGQLLRGTTYIKADATVQPVRHWAAPGRYAVEWVTQANGGPAVRVG